MTIVILLFFGASCRIRTNDPEITNHVLWPTELKRQVDKPPVSHRYNLLPLLRSSPGGVRRELVVQDLSECKSNAFCPFIQGIIEYFA